jgi:hypothetical protein
MFARWINVALGSWLAAAGWVLSGAASPARLADAADGIALAAVTLLARPRSRAGFSAIVLGIWIMCAPAALAYPSPLAALNAIAVGFAAIAVSLHPGARPAPPA